MPVVSTLLSTPVVSDRKWSTARVPNARGGFNYIAQGYNYPDLVPSQWVVVDLDAGTSTTTTETPYTAGTRGHYCAGPNYVITNQLRDPNGCVWFPAVNTWLWYYDPADETVHNLGATTSAPYDTSLYNIHLNVDGSLLLGGTIAAAQVANGNDYRPQFITVNTTTKAIRNYGRIGSTTHTQNAYGYYVHCDGVDSEHAYCLVGQDFWELVDINLTTGVRTVLAQVTTNAWAFFVEKPEGLVVQLYSNYQKTGQTLTEYWVVDGVLYPYTAGYDPATLPFTHRTVTQYNSAVSNPPDIDESRWPAFVGWRPNGSSGDYTYVPISLTYLSPINIESLVALGDGTILGSSIQYQGFFRYHPTTHQLEYFGAWSNAPSSATELVAGGKAWLTGYANGVLFSYDWTQPWTQTARLATKNPAYLGAATNGTTFSKIKTATFQADNIANNNRIYTVGLLDRSGIGMGVSYYDTGTKTFGGTSTNNDLYTDDTGIVVFSSLSRVVIGGKISSGDAQLVLYDLDLNEIERQTPIAGLGDTGRLFTTGEANVVFGLSQWGKIAYRWNVSTRTLLGSLDLSTYGTPSSGQAAQAPDGTVLVQINNGVYRINPVTLGITYYGTAPGSAIALVDTGSAVYAAFTTGLYSLALTSETLAGTGPEFTVRKVKSPRALALGAASQGCLS